ncbi:MAG TPA: hypothetical protein VKX49_12675 [Bryobacteraceae bacterium]|nr:hypothetical protein [Bryobacteraceae bacterium]
MSIERTRGPAVSGNFSATVTPPSSTTVSPAAQQSVGTASSQIVAANATRVKLIIQNTGTTVIKLNLGASSPTQNAYHIALPACGSANDESSQPYVDTEWKGAVQAISSLAGGTVVVTEENP